MNSQLEQLEQLWTIKAKLSVLTSVLDEMTLSPSPPDKELLAGIKAILQGLKHDAQSVANFIDKQVLHGQS